MAIYSKADTISTHDSADYGINCQYLKEIYNRKIINIKQ